MAVAASSVSTSEGSAPVGFDGLDRPVPFLEEIRVVDGTWSPPPALYGRSLLRAYHILRC